MDKLKLVGLVKLEQIRNGEVINTLNFKNRTMDVGVNKLLDVMFHGVAAIGTWYIGLIASYSAIAAADTMASHAGWIENVDYDEATRPAWSEGAAATRSITNATTVDFTMNATKTIKGIFLNSASDKSGTTGTLWCACAFGSTVSVNDDDVLKVTYTVSA